MFCRILVAGAGQRVLQIVSHRTHPGRQGLGVEGGEGAEEKAREAGGPMDAGGGGAGKI